MKSIKIKTPADAPLHRYDFGLVHQGKLLLMFGDEVEEGENWAHVVPFSEFQSLSLPLCLDGI